MSTTIISADLDAIVSEIEIAAPPDRVFHALTDPRELMRWFNGDESCPVKYWKMDAREGGAYSYSTNPSPTVTINGVNEFTCYGEILEYDPPRLLAYTWIGNWHLDPQRKTLVRWELSPIAGGTLVKVTHSGLAAEQAARDDYRNGWPGVVEGLKKFVEE